jgi:CxxC motif-containing protein (DUF1111 family)
MEEVTRKLSQLWSRIVARSTAALTIILFSTAMALAMAAADGHQQATTLFRPGPSPVSNPMDVLATTTAAPSEAPTGFDDQPNGMVDSSTHGMDAGIFSEVESPADGLGPLFNAQSCRECHQTPAMGGVSQVTELRVGYMDARGNFTNPNITIGDGSVTIANRSLVNDRAVCPSGDYPANEVQEHAPDRANVRTLRTSLNTLGDGFVEAISSATIIDIANKQCRSTNGAICGQAIQVPVSEAPGQTRVARFGWKNQHASLLSFSADAYLNEMGVTSRLQPSDLTSLCKSTKDPEDHQDADGNSDIDHFARFMRASKAPARDSNLENTSDAQAGAAIFDRIGCDTCHVPSIVTAPAGSVINGGTLVVPDALGNKIIHPFSDFLLHNVGTGDGIVQNGGPATAQKLRTPPLWGVRLRSRFLHDGRALTFTDAIQAHNNEGSHAAHAFQNLSDQEKQQLLTFLKSL